MKKRSREKPFINARFGFICSVNRTVFPFDERLLIETDSGSSNNPSRQAGSIRIVPFADLRTFSICNSMEMVSPPALSATGKDAVARMCGTISTLRSNSPFTGSTHLY
jgi:hypothetical protein